MTPLETFLRHKLEHRQPRVIDQPDLISAGVLIALTDCDDPHVILTRRSEQVPTHQGQVAFPGGKRDATDANIIETALREAEEEVALARDRVNVIGVLDEVVSTFGFVVTPVLGLVPKGIEMTPNIGELDCVFTAPISHFKHPPSSYFERDSLRIPNYDYEDFHIWGLTALMLAELVNTVWDVGIGIDLPS